MSVAHSRALKLAIPKRMNEWLNSPDKMAFWSLAFNILAFFVGAGVLFFGWRDKIAGDAENSKRDVLISQNNKETQNAKVDGANANKQAEEAKKEAEIAKRDAAVANLELERLRERDAPRIIQQADALKFFERVKNEPKGQVIIWDVGGTKESGSFTRQLIALMTQAGYDVYFEMSMDAGGPYTGFSIRRDSNSRIPHAAGLTEALTGLPFEHEVIGEAGPNSDEKLPVGAVIIRVRRKN